MEETVGARALVQRRRRRRSEVEEVWEPFMIGVRQWLRPYQLEWLVDKSRFRIALKARQVGWSTLMSVEAILGCVFLGRDQLFVSSSERTAMEVLEKAYRWLRVLMDTGYRFKLRSHSKTEIAVEGGGKILSLAQNPDTIRGYTGDVYLDEMAHHAMDREIYAAVLPVATLGGRISIVSTPLGQGGLFHEIWSEEGKYKSFTRHRTDISEAVRAGMPVDVELIRSNTDDETFKQEYLCEFVDESTSFYPYGLLRQCVGEPVGGGTDCYMGVDVGRKHDNTCIYVVVELNGKLSTRHVELMKNESFEAQREKIRDLILSHNVTRGRVDSTGIGMQLSEELAKEFPFIHGVPFTSESKERMAVSVRRRFESKTIQIPDDRELLSDIHSIHKAVTPGNKLKFDAARTSEGHADRFWALALAVEAATVRSGLEVLFEV